MNKLTILAALGAIIVSGSLLVPTVADAAELRGGHEQAVERVIHADLQMTSTDTQDHRA